jgi:predicted RNase H-like nuclease (RuvC/YqgF family)
MPTINARVTKLEKQVVALHKALDKEHKASLALQDRCKQLEKWVKAEVKWTKEVTDMLHQVNWAAIAVAFTGGGGGNPPQTPPDWPVP